MGEHSKAPALRPGVVSKPTGGFHPVTVWQVCTAWWAYRTGVLSRYLDFRVYLALHEVAERRLAASRVRKRKGRGDLVPVIKRAELLEELRTLVGGESDRLIRGSLARLESAGLVTLKDRLEFAIDAELLVVSSKEATNLLKEISRKPGIGKRRLAVPRPMLRHLARSATPALAATVFGCLMRCVWWRGQEIHVGGHCTARFIAERFGVDERSVKRARAELRRLGWLKVVPQDDQPCEFAEVPNLSWSGGPMESAPRQHAKRTDMSPLKARSGTGMSPVHPEKSIPPLNQGGG